MSHLLDRINELETRIQAAWETLRLDVVFTRVNELEEQMNSPNFWNNPENARAVAQEAADLKKEAEAWQALRIDTQEHKDLLVFIEDGVDEIAKTQIEEGISAIEARFAGMEFKMLFSGEFDTRNAIVSLHAGAGGTDANDWAAMLLRMYTRFAEKQGWTIEVLEESQAEVAGYKSITLVFKGRYAYGYLKSEHGVHRLVRISPFDAEQMRHTTFALCEVLPEFAEVDAATIELNPDDLRIDTYLSSGKGGQSVNTTYSAIRITHIPTNIVVSCQNERSQSQNKEIAMRMLKAKLYRLMVEARAEKIADVKGEHKTAAWGNQIRSYVLHPYKMVKDHRTNEETTDTDAVLGGDILKFIEAYLREEKRKQTTENR
jgi:peptide chain release factor 2